MPSSHFLVRAVTTVLVTVVVPLIAVHYYREVYARQHQHHPAGGGMMSALKPQPQQIIIVGAGLAGLSAAHAALTASTTASVLLLERAAKPGGNSIKASSGINGAPTRFQSAAAASQPDSAALFRDDTIRSAGSRMSGGRLLDRGAREALIGTLADRSSAAVHFLSDTVGVDLSVVSQLGGHSAARTHRGAGRTPPGFAIVSALLAKLRDGEGAGRFELRTGCEVTRLLTAAGAGGGGADRKVVVTGVEYVCREGGNSGDAEATGPPSSAHGPVIFAAGGFAGDATGLLARTRPDLGPLPSTNDARPATAHGILERDIGAPCLVDMDSVQVHPTGFVDPADPGAPVKILAAEMLRGEGGILLREGRRFVNEMDTRERVSAAVMSAPPVAVAVTPGTAGLGPPPKQWDVQILLDPGACEAAAAHVGFYAFKGLVARKKLGELDVATRQTLREYSRIVAGHEPDPFGRKAFGHWRLKDAGGEAVEEEEEQEVCIGRVTPITHFTMGGAAINERAQVLAGAGAPVEGLWAAGEITGGVHGDNRLGGSSLLECVVFGRIAGEGAAEYLHSK